MKKKILSILTLVTMLSASGCQSNDNRTVNDREGNDVSIPTKIEKIISTAPSNTEVIVDLGLSDKLVAIDKYSTDIKGVDENIEKLDFSNPDAEAIIGLEPDIIIASGHNKTGSAEDPFKSVSDAGIPVVYVPSSDSIDGIYKDIEFIADVVGAQDKGNELISEMEKEIEKVKSIGETIKDKKTVYFEIAPAPGLFTFGKSTFLNEMIEIIGAKNVFESENGWVSPSSEAVIDKNPDIIITNVTYIDNPTEEIKGRDGWEHITAIKENAIYEVDKNSSSRPSHKIILALSQMAKAVYPEQYEK